MTYENPHIAPIHQCNIQLLFFNK